MVRKKGTVVNFKSLQNMFEPVDIQIPVQNVEEKHRNIYRRNRDEDNLYRSGSKDFDNEDNISTWRADSISRRETQVDSFANVRRNIDKVQSSNIDDESWSNLRKMSANNSDISLTESSFNISNSRFTSRKSNTIDSRPQRLKLKLLPKGSKAKLEAEGKLDSILSSYSNANTNNRIDKTSGKAPSNDLVNEITKKLDNTAVTLKTALNKHNGNQDVSANELDPAVKSRMEAIRKQKEMEEANKNEILSYNALFKCDHERAKLVLDATIQIYEKGDSDFAKIVDHVNKIAIDNNTNNCFETVVPSVVACCYVICKMSNVTTLDEASETMKKLREWLKYMIKISGIEDHEFFLLNQVAIICNYFNLPSLCNNLFLIEAVFDSLYSCGIISYSSFTKWFQDDASDLPSRTTIMFQLLSWHNWLMGEIEASEDSAEEDSQDEEDIDIEALVPKRVELKGAKPVYGY